MQTLPAGQYYVGDPCYVIADEKWSDFLDAWDTQLGRDHDGHRISGIFEFEGHQVFAGYTAHGDGTFDHFPVDSGTIGVVPISLVSKRNISEEGLWDFKQIEEQGLGEFVTFDEPFEADEAEGTFYIGDMEIETDNWFDFDFTD